MPSEPFWARSIGQRWRCISPDVRGDHLLIRQGYSDRNAYFLEQVNPEVYFAGGPPGQPRIAILWPRSLVGEPRLFAEELRQANVQSLAPCVVWALGAARLG